MLTQTIPPTESWLADYGWLSANLPPGCTAEWKSKFFSLGAGIYAHAAMAPATPANGNGSNANTILALLTRANGAGMTLDQITQQLAPLSLATIKRGLATLKGNGSIAETASGQYTPVGTNNVQGIDAGKAPARRGRRPGTQAKRTGTSGD